MDSINDAPATVKMGTSPDLNQIHARNGLTTAQNHIMQRELNGHSNESDGYALLRDCNASTCLWLHDLARTVPPSAELRGFDISLDQVGTRSWLPANIRMYTWDIFEEPPPRFREYFHVVHVRLITVVIRNNDPRPVLANLTKLLNMRAKVLSGKE
ncbi:hypothetical protein GGS21DRAFT_549446 [Xylaria nigripes]|nr:hypothetical protein GGS21DRAFT_549446 [Xylaria nigripes]